MKLLKVMLIMSIMSILIVGCFTSKEGYINYETNEIYAEGETSILDEQYIPDEEYNTEDYDRIVENPFVGVMNNPLSTFSIDVDTAAYGNMRRYINRNQVPPKDAIRVEELINYFAYNYPQPENDAPFSLNMELAECTWKNGHKLLQIGIKGKDLSEEELPRSNIVFLIDVSGSMGNNDKLPLLKSAFKIMVEKLSQGDKVSIVVYAGAAGLVLEPTDGSEKEKILNSLNELEAGGSTAGGAGIELAYKIANENFIENGNNRVILATDGDFNVGSSSDSEMEALIEEKRDDGIYLTILGFGMGNYKDSKMEKMSNIGNGNYAYIDNLLEAKKVLGTELLSTLFTIAKDVKIQIEFNSKFIKGYRLIGYENRMLKNEDFNDDEKDAGEIGAGHTVTAFYEIIPAGSEEEVPDLDELEYQNQPEVIESDNYLTLKVRYKELDSNESKLIEKRPLEEEIFKETPSQEFTFASSVVEFGLVLRESDYIGDGNIGSVISRARLSKGNDEFGYRAEFIKLAEIVELLKK